MMFCATRRWCSFLLCAIFFLCLGGLKMWAENVAFANSETNYHFDVRVLLAKEILALSPLDMQRIDPGCPRFVGWSLSSPGGFVVTDVEKGLTEALPDETLVVGAKNGRLAINDRRLRSNSIEISPISGITNFGKYRYAGVMHIMLEDTGEIYLVNRLDIEDYIFSVLRWESVPGWPLEANKAMAIACRTYVVNKVLLARRERAEASYHYDVRATNAHQTYRGVHEFESLRQPVDETRGIIMAFRRTPTSKLEVIEALYDACCGGSEPAKMVGVVNFDRAPYLKERLVCHDCRKCKLFKWQKVYSIAEFEAIMRSSCPSLFRKKSARLVDVRVSKKDGSGVVHQMQIKVNGTWYALTGEQVYGIFRGTKSRMFTVEMSGNSIIFKGRGVGHGLGLCQWGAYRRAKMGKKYDEILESYYTDAIIFTTIRVTDS